MPGHHKPQLRALTGLRAVVALNVVAYHFGQPYLGGAPEWLRAAVSRGFETVSLFFVLSGFILAYVYLDDRADRRLDRRAFWMARFARIYPTYLFALVLIAPLTVRDLLQAHPASYVLTQAAEVVGLDLPMLQAWLPWAENWNFPAWALSAEACFYLGVCPAIRGDRVLREWSLEIRRLLPFLSPLLPLPCPATPGAFLFSGISPLAQIA